MIRLDTTTRKLQALLAGAITTTNPDIVASWSDKTSTTYTGGTTVTAMNGATAVDIVAAPAASTVRDVDFISIRNNDTVQAEVTVRYNDNGTTYKIVTMTLQAGEQLTYTHGEGWKVYDTNGNLRTLAGWANLNTVNAQTGTTYTLVAGDNGKIVTCSNASAITVTVPTGLGANFNCMIIQIGAGQVTVTASSTTVNSANGLKLRAQHAAATLFAYTANTFNLCGDTTT